MSNQSAFAHTARKDFPKRIMVGVLGGFVAVIALIWFSWSHFKGTTSGKVAASPTTPVLQGEIQRAGSGSIGNPWAVAEQRPRVPGRIYTSPLYDHLFLHPVSAPFPVGCMRVDVGSAVSCVCSTDQGTDAGVSVADCVVYVKTGIYDNRKRVRSAKEENLDLIRATESGPGGVGSAGAAPSAGSSSPGVASNSEG